MRKILLVNDDGYNAPGIVLVEEILKEFGEVYVVAPKEHQSGKGCSIILKSSYDYIKVDDHHYMVDGVPTSCTMFGLNALGVKFDLVVSGCNNGFNLSNDTMYSGTAGACFEALFQRIPAIALSCQFNFEIVKNNLSMVLNYIFNNNLLSSDYMLNVNFPLGEVVEGIKITELHPSYIKYEFKVDEGNSTYSDKRYNVDEGANEKSDVYAVHHGFISITPLRMNTFCKELL